MTDNPLENAWRDYRETDGKTQAFRSEAYDCFIESNALRHKSQIQKARAQALLVRNARNVNSRKLAAQSKRLEAQSKTLEAQAEQKWHRAHELWAMVEEQEATAQIAWLDAVSAAHGNIRILSLTRTHCRLANGESYDR